MVFLDLFGPALLVGSVGYILWRYSTCKRLQIPFPPGPKGLPLLGNIREIPTRYEWLGYHDFAKQYGDVTYFEVLGRSIVVLDSLKATNDLLERRGAIYSSRPSLRMLYHCGFMFPFSSRAYGEEWRQHRRHFHKHVHQNVVDRYMPVQLWSTHTFLRQLVESPNDFASLSRELLGRTILRMVYDIKTTGKDDPYITVIESALRCVDDAVIPGKYLVEVIPQLSKIPDWMPGTGWKQLAARCRRLVEEMMQGPFDSIKCSMREGSNKPCMVSRMLDECPSRDPAYETMVKELGTIAYIGGADTIHSSAMSFYMAMLKYPEVQARAQAELDDVIGSSRMPNFGDRPSLPYIEAVLAEVLRWIPVLPLGVPHATTEDDTYRGWFIPKGTIVMHNTWSILHDPEAYPEPEAFKPERFLKTVDGRLKIDDSVRNPRVVAFGAGRRICPGRFIGENTLWLLIASFLHTMSIAPAISATGQPIDVPIRINPGFMSHLPSFKCAIKPRSAQREALIRQAEFNSQI